MEIAYSVSNHAPVKSVDINAQKTITCATTGEAMKLYYRAAERLLYVNRWGELAGEEKHYTLLAPHGKTKTGCAVTGDYIQINLTPGPLSNYTGVEWLLVEKILQIKTDELESTAIRVRQAFNPASIEAYYAANTNTFIVERHGHSVRAYFHPHHEVPDMEKEISSYDGLNNALQAVATWLGISKSHWNNLVDGLLAD